MKGLILLALLGLVLPGELEAVKSCYQCLKCKDPFDTTLKATPCPTASNACVKTKTIVEGENSVLRTCFPTASGTCKSSDDSAKGARIIISCCTTDDCNAGMMTSFSLVTMVTSLLMAYLVKARF